MKSLSLFSFLLGFVAIILAALAVVGCVGKTYTDGTYALLKKQRANEKALAVAKDVSHQIAPAQPVVGDALVRLLSGNTHISEYRRQATDAKPHFTMYEYFSADGTHIVRDTYSRRTAAYETKGHWRVNHDVLCITDREDGKTEKCYTVRLSPAHAVEFWHHKPGDAFHGLFATAVVIVRPGLQTPEYTTASSPYGQ